MFQCWGVGRQGPPRAHPRSRRHVTRARGRPWSSTRAASRERRRSPVGRHARRPASRRRPRSSRGRSGPCSPCPTPPPLAGRGGIVVDDRVTPPAYRCAGLAGASGADHDPRGAVLPPVEPIMPCPFCGADAVRVASATGALRGPVSDNFPRGLGATLVQADPARPEDPEAAWTALGSALATRAVRTCEQRIPQGAGLRTR